MTTQDQEVPADGAAAATDSSEPDQVIRVDEVLDPETADRLRRSWAESAAALASPAEVVACRLCGEEGPSDAPHACRGSYVRMLQDYLAEQTWITMADRPLVFHLERLCKQLDRDPSAPAAVSSAYLQAFSRLDRRRPGATPDPGGDPAQTSIFDFVDD